MPVHKLRENVFKRRLKEGVKQPGLWLTLESPNATEVLAGSGYDWLLLDMEHTTLDASGVADHIRGAVDGVDAMFIGPNDLAANMGLYGKPGAPEVKAVIADAIGRIRKTGKGAGILNFNIAEARDLFKAGYDFVAVNSDLSILARRS